MDKAGFTMYMTRFLNTLETKSITVSNEEDLIGWGIEYLHEGKTATLRLINPSEVTKVKKELHEEV